MLFRKRSGGGASRRGSAAVGLAIVLPVLALVVVDVLNFVSVFTTPQRLPAAPATVRPTPATRALPPVPHARTSIQEPALADASNLTP
jgi:hypothetical protein